jgi:hypothetical protein
VGNFYTEDAYAIISGEINLIILKTVTKDKNEHMVDHIHLDKKYIHHTLHFKEYYEGLYYLFFSL